MPKDPAQPLRILAVVNLPWDSRLGASRVWIELSKEWERAGHIVERFCLTDAFPEPASSRASSALRQLRFPARAAAYVRQNASRFDVIDALIGVLPYPKSSLCFSGLVVARSVGLYRLYDQFVQRSRALWPDQPKGRWFGRFFHRSLERRARQNSERSVQFCDLMNVPNEDERRELEQAPEIGARAIVQPYGLSDDFRHALSAAAAPAQERLHRQKICFIGMWGPRKGAYDWPRIIAAVRQRHPAAKFLLLGTMFDESVVRLELGSDDGISCRTTFAEADLPELLGDCAVGLFPSYIEGFGLALLEQLAARLPTIAYDVPGPRQILHPQRARLLTVVGDPAALAARACEILALNTQEYEQLSADCAAIAQQYRWQQIARETVEDYRAALELLGRRTLSA
ncbi:MAG: glycosyltransferase family 4 protein [Chthoniobacterales bacterium]